MVKLDSQATFVYAIDLNEFLLEQKLIVDEIFPIYICIYKMVSRNKTLFDEKKNLQYLLHNVNNI